MDIRAILAAGHGCGWQSGIFVKMKGRLAVPKAPVPMRLSFLYFSILSTHSVKSTLKRIRACGFEVAAFYAKRWYRFLSPVNENPPSPPPNYFFSKKPKTPTPRKLAGRLGAGAGTGAGAVGIPEKISQVRVLGTLRLFAPTRPEDVSKFESESKRRKICLISPIHVEFHLSEINHTTMQLVIGSTPIVVKRHLFD